jgi:predicted ArsR family transcriptional regulator
MASWTFITNHAVVLTYLGKHPTITARQVALEIGITERAVRTIIDDLEAEGYIVKAKEGRRSRYSVNAGLPLRHSTQSDKQVGQLLKLLGSVGKPLKKRSSKRS